MTKIEKLTNQYNDLHLSWFGVEISAKEREANIEKFNHVGRELSNEVVTELWKAYISKLSETITFKPMSSITCNEAEQVTKIFVQQFLHGAIVKLNLKEFKSAGMLKQFGEVYEKRISDMIDNNYDAIIHYINVFNYGPNVDEYINDYTHAEILHSKVFKSINDILSIDFKTMYDFIFLLYLHHELSKYKQVIYGIPMYII